MTTAHWRGHIGYECTMCILFPELSFRRQKAEIDRFGCKGCKGCKPFFVSWTPHPSPFLSLDKNTAVVAGLWTSIQNWLKPLNIYFEFTPLNIIFGVLEENGPEIINTIILLGKIFIFKTQSRMNLNLSFFKNTVRKQFLLEKIIATNQCKVVPHNKKWEKICICEEWEHEKK